MRQQFMNRSLHYASLRSAPVGMTEVCPDRTSESFHGRKHNETRAIGDRCDAAIFPRTVLRLLGNDAYTLEFTGSFWTSL